MNIRQIVGDNVRCFRHKLSWSQEKLGAEVGLNHDYIGRLERGLENISIDNLVKIASVNNVHPSVLLIENYCFEKFDLPNDLHAVVSPHDKQPKIVQDNVKKV